MEMCGVFLLFVCFNLHHDSHVKGGNIGTFCGMKILATLEQTNFNCASDTSLHMYLSYALSILFKSDELRATHRKVKMPEKDAE